MEDYYGKATSFGNLYNGMKKSCRNVRWKDSVVGYEWHGLANTLKLEEELKTGRYRLSGYQTFMICEPKRREIKATRIRDRQVQRSLCDNGLYEDICEHFIRDNCACQVGRGTDDALRRMKVHLQRHWRKHGRNGWVLKCDVKGFFANIDHEVAKSCIRRYVSDSKAADYVCNVIDSFDSGLGLGSQISQLVALSVLDDLDHLIKEQLHIKGYVRYMDDFVLIHENKEHLKYCLSAINAELESKGLALNGKTSLFPVKQGIVFLHWRFVLTDTGKVLMLLDHKKMSKERKRLKKLVDKEKRGEAKPGTAEQSLVSWIANANRGNSKKAIKSMREYYKSITEV